MGTKKGPELSLRRCKRRGSASPLEVEGTLFKILTFLPLCKIYELRLVCKSWNALLTSPAFLSAWSLTAHEELLVMVRNVPSRASARLLIAFDSGSHQWISLQPLLASCPQPALYVLGGPLLPFVGNPLPGRNLSLSYFVAVSGAPGLVCMLHSPLLRACSVDRYVSHRFSLIVMNLFTGSHHLLPTPPRHCDELVSWDAGPRISMASLPHGDYYVFVQPRWHPFPGQVEIYDSCSRSWKVGKSCCHPSDAKIATAADVNRADLVQHLRGTGVVFAYSVELDEWSQVFAENPLLSDCEGEGKFYNPLFCRDGCILFRNRGQIFLAAVRCEGDYCAGFVVWKLLLRHSVPPASAVPGTPIADWVEVASTPQHLWKGIHEVEYGYKRVKIISSGNLICMTAISYTETKHGQSPLVYDLVRNSWYHLPSYKGVDDLSAAFSLQPSFVAIS